MDCLKCGQCCRHLILDIGCNDVCRSPEIREWVIQQRGSCDCAVDEEGYTEHDGDCACLLEKVGDEMQCHFLGEDNLCTIYETRPDMCYGFRPGSWQCLYARGLGEL
jgi:hypothetical protein